MIADARQNMVCFRQIPSKYNRVLTMVRGLEPQLGVGGGIAAESASYVEVGLQKQVLGR